MPGLAHDTATAAPVAWPIRPVPAQCCSALRPLDRSTMVHRVHGSSLIWETMRFWGFICRNSHGMCRKTMTLWGSYCHCPMLFGRAFFWEPYWPTWEVVSSMQENSREGLGTWTIRSTPWQGKRPSHLSKIHIFPGTTILGFYPRVCCLYTHDGWVLSLFFPFLTVNVKRATLKP